MLGIYACGKRFLIPIVQSLYSEIINNLGLQIRILIPQLKLILILMFFSLLSQDNICPHKWWY